MTEAKKDKSAAGAPDKGTSSTDRETGAPSSGNREESMGESGEDAFARGGAVRKKTEDTSQKSATSGTSGLTGESSDSDLLRGPGGVEGTGGNG